MSENERTFPALRLHPWRYLPILIILGLVVHLLVPQIAALEKSWAVIQAMTWWVVILAIVAQVLSYIGSGYMLHTIMAINQQKLSTLKGILITMAANSIGLVAGGWVSGDAATFGWVRQETHDGNDAALASTLPTMLNNVILAVVSGIGVIYLLAIHDLSQGQLLGFSVVLLLICLLMAGAVATFRYPEPATRLAVKLSGRSAKMRHKAFQPQDTMVSVQRFIQSWQSLGHGRWMRPALGALANTGFDMLTLYLMFIAAGHRVGPGVLFAGYGLPYMLGKIAFVFPGGVGVVEAGMVALYGSLGVPNEVSAVVILGYRLISFWIPSLLGFAAAAYLGSGASKSKESQSPVSLG